MKDLISVIAKALVDFPDQVEIKEVEGDKTTVGFVVLLIAMARSG